MRLNIASTQHTERGFGALNSKWDVYYIEPLSSRVRVLLWGGGGGGEMVRARGSEWLWVNSFFQIPQVWYTNKLTHKLSQPVQNMLRSHQTKAQHWIWSRHKALPRIKKWFAVDTYTETENRFSPIECISTTLQSAPMPRSSWPT